MLRRATSVGRIVATSSAGMASHVGRICSVKFFPGNRWYEGTVREHDAETILVYFPADGEKVSFDVQEEESEEYLFIRFRWLDHEFVGKRVRLFVRASDGEIVVEDTGTPVDGKIVGWWGGDKEAGGDDDPVWRAELRAADGEVLEHDLAEDEARAAIAAAPETST